jgi:hypothetical protein
MLKAFIAAAALAAVLVGLALPVPHKGDAGHPAKSAFATIELGRG